MLIVKYVKNGLYIPFVHGIIYKKTKNIYLATIVSLKLVSTNHFIWFGHTEHISPKLVQCKQFVRFTDSGHLASLIYFFRPEFLPIAHNIHFFIMICYWLGKLLGIKESGNNVDAELIPQVQIISSGLNHGLVYGFLFYDIISSSNCVFSSETLFYSYVWAYTWLFCVYMPWRYITNDEVYSVLSEKTHIFIKITFFIIVNMIMYLGNYTGKRLTL